MIDIEKFVQYLKETFEAKKLSIDHFKPQLWFIQIDCFETEPYKMAIEVSIDDIKISTVDKLPSMDFSLYDYVFRENKAAEDFIKKIVKRQAFK